MTQERRSISTLLADAECTPVLRTDFSDQEAWEDIRGTIETPTERDEFVADVTFFDDGSCAGLTAEEIVALVPDDYDHAFLVIVDDVATASDEMPLLCVDLADERGRTVRVVAAELWSIENNLSLANMDFEEFVDAAEADGVFRGF
ncbi:DUF6924 domain-containing protein [Streptomyces griseocarneus]|uniref:DUF6924 domain-containing protein n=1 Tax=Streptomyces griseocarneus TaxID=51201 RepID=UPI00167C5561|nr:hypothetical protein [Streptomyces griseocarneus]MBZ6478188.1 hypothetical protein [Streptomyces griseocarneus]GHG84302.1 hypothetical protein GCM10018779_67680 [Streptomyces griseocarneus]